MALSQVLVVDDEVGIRELLSEILHDEGYNVRLAEHAAAARAARKDGRPDLVLLDIWMPDTDGITLLKEWASSGQLTMPVVMMSGHATIDTAVEATRIGAFDFLEKPISLQKLLGTVKRALVQQEPRGAKSLNVTDAAKSPVLADFKKRLARIAQSRSWVLLRGERGAMAESYARALQAQGSPWLQASAVLGKPVNDIQQQGMGGILFIEDLAKLSANQQRHLAFLVAHVDKAKLRLVSFSSEGPRRLGEARGYDAALLSRLSEVVLAIPPLRDHAEDLPDIASFLLAQLVEARICPMRRFSPQALAVLSQHSWP